MVDIVNRWVAPIASEWRQHGSAYEVARLLTAPARRGLVRLAVEHPENLPTAGPATIAIYDALGSRLRQWSWRQLPAGGHEVHWDGRTEDGRLIPPGVLFSRLEAAGQTLQRKIIHLQ